MNDESFGASVNQAHALQHRGALRITRQHVRKGYRECLTLNAHDRGHGPRSRFQHGHGVTTKV
ncbi:hypothetical protein ACIQB5_50315 [Streptomyces sp. NPDC088560]|uniref:hypothetical protein n=1 Tax=Streptomyces sp. NPDC088560 TaxID=3365868 RepID=UPI003810C20F